MGYYSIDLRSRAVKSYLEGVGSLSEVSESYDISVSSLKRWLRLYRAGVSLHSLSEGKGRNPKIDGTGKKFISQIVKKKPDITLRELTHIYYKRKGVKAGRSVLSRVLQKLNLRYKKLSIQASEKQTPEVKKKEKIILKK